ncbi:hypothetical protein P152DRAFT_459235 [Eremomyces bilateralis CBS 781.70]|uniref:Adenylyl cyclase-associated protein n=1 Tax=Eremomyces bilateralis CBS 781.70 TaxID=1392243 RepID=A0A6G1G145_9PEZI|nr:uncharacterized protein P152DRAFT_459235 [Eremomyces bilateralis CBS 781.70]KAF1811774.1 hypothetical protein P152DRAFT_459235 [Eremomyces bilateralis CBS 781.70]
MEANPPAKLARPISESSLTELLHRLEAATSRLEDIASSAASYDPADSQPGTTAPAAATSKPDSSAKQPPPSAASTPRPETPSEPSIPNVVALLDSLMSEALEPWMELSEKIGGLVKEQSAGVDKAFQEQRSFILLTTQAKNPGQDSATYMECLVGIQSQIIKVDEMVSKNYGSQFRDHLAMVAGGLQCLSWVTVDSKPQDLVSELFGGAQMYGNKILQKYKTEDQTQVKWVQAFYKLFKMLQEYIRTNFPKGITWNPKGIEASEALKQAKASKSGAKAPGPPGPPPPPAGGAPPPPPPPAPAPPPFTGDVSKSSAKEGDMGAVFQELSKGESVTQGLRKVQASQQTHKNPSLRAAAAAVPTRSDSSSSAGRGKSPTPPGKKPKPESMRTKKPPRKELDGNKWIIENYDSPAGPVEISVELSHSILITRCKNTTIRIHGKANAISADSSSRLSIILDSLVSSVDVIKCPNFAVQVLGSIPTILLDQVDGATVYLSKESAGSEIFSSKCSSVNVNVLGDGDDGDYKECPVPEQMRSFIKDGKLVTEIVEHAG